MAQETSDLWKTFFRDRSTRKEYGFDINGTWYGPESEVTHSVDSGLSEDFSIGNATTAKLTLTLYTEQIPRSATIKRYVRLKNGEQVSEWIPKGVFFTNRRGEKDGRWTIEAFDAMRKADVIWGPGESLQFPLAMPDAILRAVRGMEYKMYIASDTNIDPSAELGDGMTACNLYFVIARIDDDGSGYPTISAPGEEELEYEYPFVSPVKRKLDQIDSKVDEIEQRMNNELKRSNSAAGLRV